MPDNPYMYVFQANAAAATVLLFYKYPLYWDVYISQFMDPNPPKERAADERLGLPTFGQDELDAYAEIRERRSGGKIIPPELLRARFLARAKRYREMANSLRSRLDEITDEAESGKREVISSPTESDELSSDTPEIQDAGENELKYRGAALAHSYFDPNTTSVVNYRLIVAFVEGQLFSALANNAEKFAKAIDQIIENGVIDVRDTKHFSGVGEDTPGDFWLWSAEKYAIDYLVDRYIRAAHEASGSRAEQTDPSVRPDFLTVTNMIISVGNSEIVPLLDAGKSLVANREHIMIQSRQVVYSSLPRYKSLDGKSTPTIADEIILGRVLD